MSTLKTFLIKAENGREAVMRLPVDQYGGITRKGYQMVRTRFFDGSINRSFGVAYLINLEYFSDGKALAKAIENYNNGII